MVGLSIFHTSLSILKFPPPELSIQRHLLAAPQPAFNFAVSVVALEKEIVLNV